MRVSPLGARVKSGPRPRRATRRRFRDVPALSRASHPRRASRRRFEALSRASRAGERPRTALPAQEVKVSPRRAPRKPRAGAARDLLLVVGQPLDARLGVVRAAAELDGVGAVLEAEVLDLRRGRRSPSRPVSEPRIELGDSRWQRLMLPLHHSEKVLPRLALRQLPRCLEKRRAEGSGFRLMQL